MNIGPRKIKIDGAGPFRAVGIFEMTAVGQCLLKTIKFDITQRGTIVDHILRNTGNRKTSTVIAVKTSLVGNLLPVGRLHSKPEDLFGVQFFRIRIRAFARHQHKGRKEKQEIGAHKLSD